VLDKDICWTRMQFVAPDAFVEPSETPGWRKWRIATPDDNERADGEIVPGGWDHEHCELCWQRIGSGGDRERYTGANQWVCVRCYKRYIAPRDLRFVVEGPSDDSDESAGSMHMFQAISRLIEDYDLAAIRGARPGGSDVGGVFQWVMAGDAPKTRRGAGVAADCRA
jgi:hypothetical protein